MDNVLDRTWTVESFLAWEDRQEGKHEFDGRGIVPMTGGSVAHQRMVINLVIALWAVFGDAPGVVMQEMRLRFGNRVRYPDVLVGTAPADQTSRSATDALAIFEVLSRDTARTDRVLKLAEYKTLPSLRTYVLLEQTERRATVYSRSDDGSWEETSSSDIVRLAGTDASLDLADIYRGLTFAA